MARAESADRTRGVTIRWRRMSQLDFFLGTLAPFLRASEPDGDGLLSTFDFAAFATLARAKRATLSAAHSALYLLPAPLPYLRRPDFLREPFLVAIWVSPDTLEDQLCEQVVRKLLGIKQLKLGSTLSRA